MTPAEWLWIPVTIWAAFAQTLRNAAQRHLTESLGTLGATLVRFLYGLPFAAAWLALVHAVGDLALPAPSAGFAAWVAVGALAQIAATAALLRVMAARNFALGVAYSKTEIIQVAVFALVFLGDPVTAVAALAIACGTLGVLLLSPADGTRPLRELAKRLRGGLRPPLQSARFGQDLAQARSRASSTALGWTSRPALLGLASGACFALSAVGYRGAALALDAPFLMAAAYTLLVAQVLQTIVLGGWLAWRDAPVVARVFRAWRASLFAGFMGAAASAGWFTAMAIEPVAHVRTLGLVELLFSAVVSRRFFRERMSALEAAGVTLLTLGVVIVTFAR